MELTGCGAPPPTASKHLPGDPRAGLSVYKFEGCGACHPISGVSVGLGSPPKGPSLDGEGGKRTLSWLRTKLPAHLRQVGAPALSPRDEKDLLSYLASLR